MTHAERNPLGNALRRSNDLIAPPANKPAAMKQPRQGRLHQMFRFTDEATA